MKYIQNEIGDVKCRDKKGKEKWIALPSVLKGDPDSPDFKGLSYLKGFSPVKSVAEADELASEIKELMSETVSELVVEESIESIKPSNMTDRSKNYNTTIAGKMMKEMNNSDLDAFTQGDERLVVIKNLNKLKNK